MSSILEALRELEGDRATATRHELPPSDGPRVARRAAGAVIPLLGGLAVGIVVFGVWALAPRKPAPPRREAPAPEVERAPAPAAVPERPAWLDTAEAPRARVSRGATTPEPAVAAAPARPAEPREEPAPRADEPVPASSGGQVAVEAISYSATPGARVVTMRIHGRRVTLRESESFDDIAIQLIQPNGVYVQRANEVYLLPLSRR